MREKNIREEGGEDAILYSLHKKPLGGWSIIVNSLHEMAPEVQ